MHIKNEATVSVKGLLEVNGERETLAVAQAIIPTFNFDCFMDTETFNIALQSKFVNNKDRGILLKVVGNVAEENVKLQEMTVLAKQSLLTKVLHQKRMCVFLIQ